MISRKELFTSIFNKKNIVKAIDSILPVNLPEEKAVIDIPELTGELLFYEAMRLGIDPATIPPDKLKQMVTAEIIKEQKLQAPSEPGTALAGNSVNG